MKKIILLGIVLFLLILPLISPQGNNLSVALAQEKGLVPCDGVNVPCDACALTSMANSVINFMFVVLTLIVVLMIMYAGFQLVISQGQTEAWSEAKSMFTNVVIGFIIILAAWLIVDTVIKTLADSKAGLGMWNRLSSDCSGYQNKNSFGGPR